ncbi:hypothetical protein VE00_10145 [Pseudogymnoascus sp. WSF 3629]|nr:hypothetical protein VE00_10145 [Pseudogymnoascus sp. WSF 3629]
MIADRRSVHSAHDSPDKTLIVVLSLVSSSLPRTRRRPSNAHPNVQNVTMDVHHDLTFSPNIDLTFPTGSLTMLSL